MENKAYETDETEKKNNATDDKNDTVTQSQIEIGFIESMVNNSKVQHQLRETHGQTVNNIMGIDTFIPR